MDIIKKEYKINTKTEKGAKIMDIRFINVEHSIKFKTVKDATREANRIKMVMDRFAKKTKIPFSCIICVSQLSLRFGEFVTFHNNKKGRPIRKMVSKLKCFGVPETVLPHLHIVIVYKEQEKKISNKIIESITKKYGKESCKAYDITNKDPIYFLQYIIRQSGTFRYVEDFTNTISSFNFKNMNRLLTKQRESFYFHKNNRFDSRFDLPAA